MLKIDKQQVKNLNALKRAAVTQKSSAKSIAYENRAKLISKLSDTVSNERSAINSLVNTRIRVDQVSTKAFGVPSILNPFKGAAKSIVDVSKPIASSTMTGRALLPVAGRLGPVGIGIATVALAAYNIYSKIQQAKAVVDILSDVTGIGQGSSAPKNDTSYDLEENKKSGGKFRWVTKGDGKVRETHAELDGKVFDWATGANGLYPGQDYNCRCIAEPVLEDQPIKSTKINVENVISNMFAGKPAQELFK